jgi:hypothetical protein
MNAEQQVKYLALELAKSKAETAKLRKKLQMNNRHARRINKAYEDALLLAIWRASGIPPSRNFAKRHGITQNRWQNAQALLRMARIVERRCHWVTDNLTVIEQRLSSVKERAIETPTAFKARLNKHGSR